jgi:hypothetical protein
MSKEISDENTKLAKVAKVSGPQAVMVSAGDLRKQMKRDQDIRIVINEYIKSNMVKGKDFGAIEGKTKSGSKFAGKPTLLKPGAEKFCSLFKVRPTFKKDTDTLQMLGDQQGIVAYICELVDSHGIVVGEGRGVSKTSLSADDFDTNKAVKIAEKRAQIDAVLRTGALSDFFTQDIEDMPADADAPKQTKPASPKQKAFIMSLLYQAGVKRDDAVATIKLNGVADPESMTSDQASKLIETAQSNMLKLLPQEEDNQEVVDIEVEPVLEEVSVVEDAETIVDAQFIDDVMTKTEELGLSAQDRMRLFKDVTGAPYAPKDDKQWIALSDRLDVMADEKGGTKNGK